MVPKHGVMYLGDYPECYAPDYCSGVDYNSDEGSWLSGDSGDSDSSYNDEVGAVIMWRVLCIIIVRDVCSVRRELCVTSVVCIACFAVRVLYLTYVILLT